MSVKLTNTLSALVLCVLLGLLVSACSPTQDTAQSLRFLYVVNCDARVDKLDTFERKKIETFRLSDRSGSPPAVPTAPDGKMDGCLTQRLTIDAARQQASLVSPKDARLDSDGLQEFQAITFTLPDWKLVSAQPAGKLPEAPHLQLDATGKLKVLSDAEWLPVTQLDLRQYKGQNGDIGSILLASSGNISLLSLLSGASDRLALGLADQATHTLKRLADLPPTSLRNVHLAPGGGYVLVEITDATGSAAKRTGVLRLYDNSAMQVAELVEPQIQEMTFVALTPNGTAVYKKNGEYDFISMGRSFGSANVTTPLPALADPGLVYAAK